MTEEQNDNHAEDARREAVRRAYLAKIVRNTAENLPPSPSLSAKERWTLLRLLGEIAANTEAINISAAWGTVESLCAWSQMVFNQALNRGDLKKELGNHVAGGAIISTSVFGAFVSKVKKFLSGKTFSRDDLKDDTNQQYATSVMFLIEVRRGRGIAFVAKLNVEGNTQGTRFDWQPSAEILDIGVPARLAPALVAARSGMPARNADPDYEILIATRKAEVERAFREEFDRADVPELRSTVVRHGIVSGKKFIMVTAITMLLAVGIVAAVPPLRTWALEKLQEFIKRAAEEFRGQTFRPQGTPSDTTSPPPASVGATPEAFARAMYEVNAISSPEFKGELNLDPWYQLQFLGDSSLHIHLDDAGGASHVVMRAVLDPAILRPNADWQTPLRCAWGIYRVLPNGALEGVHLGLGMPDLSIRLEKPKSYLVIMSYTRILRLDPEAARKMGYSLANVEKSAAKYVVYVPGRGGGRHVVRSGGFIRGGQPSRFVPGPVSGLYTFEGTENDADEISGAVSLSPVLAHMKDHAVALPHCSVPLSIKVGEGVTFRRPASQIGRVELQKVACFDAHGDLASWTQEQSAAVTLHFERPGRYECVNMLFGPTATVRTNWRQIPMQSCGQTVTVLP
jgi:hypothetical protein